MNAFFISMFKRLFLLALLFASSLVHAKQQYKIGLLVMATGKYTCFLEKLFTSADRFFLPNHERIYFVFTDGQILESNHIVRIEQKRLGWPYDTMMRFKVYQEWADLFADCDYLFACDADMLFVDTVADEILADRVGTLHPGFCLSHQRHDDYEKNEASCAYIPEGQGSHYFAGGFYGGSKKEFLKLIATCNAQIEQDLNNGITAVWHDESHLNRYFFDNPPSTILSPSYCFPEFWDLPFTPKLMALCKDHKEFQV